MVQQIATRTVPERQPRVGELVQVRSRRWLVDEVIESKSPEQTRLVRLSCADDDAQGQSLDVLWDYELDRFILEQKGWADLATKGFDQPRQFAAFLHRLRWNCVTATDPNLFQAALPRRDQDRRLPDGAAPKSAPSAACQPLHRRRHGPRQDDRGRSHRPRAASAQESVECEVPLFVTLGSPLGIDLVREYLKPPRLHVPPGVRKWLNGSDIRDHVALYPALTKDNFCDGVENLTDVANSQDNPHSINDYLTDPRVAKRIAEALA